MDGIKEFVVAAVTGREEKARAWLLNRYQRQNAVVDKAGNVVFMKKGNCPNAPRRMVVAPMDEVGLYAISAVDDGLIHVRTAGEVDPRLLVSKRVFVGYEKDGKEPVKGVIGAMAIHLQTPEDRRHVMPETELYVDIGAKNKDEALQYAPQGTPIWFDSLLETFGSEKSPVLAGRAADRVLLWQIMDRLSREDVAGDTWFVFAARSEVGGGGAKGAVYALEPDECLYLTGVTADDAALEKGDSSVRIGCSLRGGAAVAFGANRALCAKNAVKTLRIAREQNIPAQEYLLRADCDNLSESQLSHTGVDTVLLGLPVRYRRSPAPMAAFCDADALFDLAACILKSKEF